MSTKCIGTDKLVFSIPIVISLVFILLLMAQAQKKFVLDEIDFPVVSNVTSQTGVPIYYRGEGKELSPGTYHPTLYINAQALFIRILGFNENVIRAFGMLCTLGTAFFSVLILGLLFTERKHGIAKIIFCSLYLLHPYTITSATLPDIDSTVLPLVITIFFYVMCKFILSQNVNTVGMNNSSHNFSIYIGLSLIFSLCLWTKLTTPLVLPLFLFLALVLFNHKSKQASKICLIVIILGFTAFISSYWIYCYLLDLPFKFTFNFLLHSFNKGSDAASFTNRLDNIIRNLNYSREFIHWISVPFFALMISGVLYIFIKYGHNFRKYKEHWFLIILFSFGIFILVAYSAVIPPFGGFFKYPFAGFHFLIFPAVFMITDIVDIYNVKKIIIVIVGIIAIAAIENFLFGDIFLRNKHQVSFGFLFLLVFIGSILSIIIYKTRYGKCSSILALTLFTITVGVGLGVSRSQAISPYPTKYYYGQVGLDETISYLKANAKSDEIIWGMKDVGFYVNNKYEESYPYFHNVSYKDKLVKLMENGIVKYYVVTFGIGEDNVLEYPEILNLLTTHGRVEKTFGNYVIFSAGKHEDEIIFPENQGKYIQLNDSVKLTGFYYEHLFHDKYTIYLRFNVLRKIERDWNISFHAHTSEEYLKYLPKDRIIHKFDNWDFNPQIPTSSWPTDESIIIKTIVTAQSIPYYLGLGFYLPEFGYFGKEADLGWNCF